MAHKGSSKTRHPLWHIIGNGKRRHQNNDPLVPDGFKYRFGTESKDKGDTFNADPSLETKYRCVVKRYGVYGKTQYRGPLTKRYTP